MRDENSWARRSMRHLIQVIQEARTKYPDETALSQEYIAAERTKWLAENPEPKSTATPATDEAPMDDQS